MIRYSKLLSAAMGAMLLAACQDNPLAPSRDQLVAGSPQTLQSLATGVIAQNRAEVAGGLYTLVPNIISRDAMALTVNETRYTSDFYSGPPDPLDFLGSSSWAGNYLTIRAIHSLLQSPAYTTLVDSAEKNAVAGAMRNIKVIAYLRVIETHDQNGMVIQPEDPTVLGPIKTKASALAYLSALADSAIDNLTNAGTTIPFTFPSGYTLHGDYTTVAGQLRLAHALKGEIELYRALSDPSNPVPANATTAITELDLALDDAPVTLTQEYLNQGPWYEFNPLAPESTPNPLTSSSFFLTDNFANSINSLDTRKANILSANGSANGFTSDYRWTTTDVSVSANRSLPLPILRNANLYLLRAQAKVLTSDLLGATADVNAVHQIEGGLPAYVLFPNAATAIDAILYEYRYSFIYVGPQHLVARRQYNKLDNTYLSQSGMPTSASNITLALPISGFEATARGGNVTPEP